MLKKNKNNKNKTFIPDKMLLSPDSSFSMQESFKTLRTNVSFSLPGKKNRCIGIVSANRGEGKSTVAVNTAISLAQIDKKVAIVDCDMRIPTVAAKLGMENRPGLSDYLADEDGNSRLPIIRNDDLNIDVIPAGTIPPDPTKLIESPQMRELIEALKMVYDYIVVDFPPVTVVSDAAILSSVIDGYLIVTLHESTETSQLDETIRQLNFANANILGFVYNSKPASRKSYKKNSKYYYYEYR
ncbi:MAG: CpsD/CapB family tyrosine-protein kinase [Ruminococcus sp.]|nr:CpsD/CapB family tyrosine-protein kinase [Ruminococcus sp.]